MPAPEGPRRRRQSTPEGAAAAPVPKIESAEVPIGSLIPNRRNPKGHSEEQIGRVAGSIQQPVGQYRRIIVRRENMMILAGHATWEAAKRAGLETVRVELVDIDEAAGDALMIGDNHLADLGKIDNEKLASLLAMAAEDQLPLTGYTGDEVDELLRKQKLDDAPVVEIDTRAGRPRSIITIQLDLADQPWALDRLRRVMAGEEMPADRALEADVAIALDDRLF